MEFGTSTLEDIEVARPEALDVLAFGIIGFGPDGVVDRYNATESRLAGLSPDRVLGKHIFTAVAPCMNNYLVAQRSTTKGSWTRRSTTS